MHFDFAKWTIFVATTMLGALLYDIFVRLSDLRATRKSLKSLATAGKRAALREAFGVEETSLRTEVESLCAKRAAMLENYAKNSVPFVVKRPNRAWRKWSKPAASRIHSRP
jgi:DNA topoisomerase IB